MSCWCKMQETRIYFARGIKMSDIGNIYLTNGNRIVLNKGSGEYFDETDILLFTQEQLTKGIPFTTFMRKMNKLKVEE